MSRGSTISLILIIIVVLAIGIGVGIIAGKQLTTPQTVKTQTTPNTPVGLSSTQARTLKALQSKPMQYVDFAGTVKSVMGSTITLTFEKEDISLSVKSTANIISLKQVNGKTTSQKIALKDIKAGQGANATASMLANGDLEVSGITIYSPVK